MPSQSAWPSGTIAIAIGVPDVCIAGKDVPRTVITALEPIDEPAVGVAVGVVVIPIEPLLVDDDALAGAAAFGVPLTACATTTIATIATRMMPARSAACFETLVVAL